MSDTLLAEAPVVPTKSSVQTDPMGQVERAQAVFEKGPITAVAAFFAVAFFVALYLLLRAKDRHQTMQYKLQADQAKEVSRLTEKHGQELSVLYNQERERAVKHEVTMSNYLDMMDDVRFIAFEMRRVKLAREKKRHTGEYAAVGPDDKEGNSDG